VAVVVSLLLQIIVWNVLSALPEWHSKGTADEGLFALRGLLLGLFAFSVLVLVTAIAFVKRREWARRAFIALFGLVIVLNLFSLIPFLFVWLFSEPAPMSG
jgi:hypothetical protein